MTLRPPALHAIGREAHHRSPTLRTSQKVTLLRQIAQRFPAMWWDKDSSWARNCYLAVNDICTNDSWYLSPSAKVHFVYATNANPGCLFFIRKAKKIQNLNLDFCSDKLWFLHYPKMINAKGLRLYAILISAKIEMQLFRGMYAWRLMNEVNMLAWLLWLQLKMHVQDNFEQIYVVAFPNRCQLLLFVDETTLCRDCEFRALHSQLAARELDVKKYIRYVCVCICARMCARCVCMPLCLCSSACVYLNLTCIHI